MDPTTFDKRAGELLFGLGFSQVTCTSYLDSYLDSYLTRYLTRYLTPA